MEMKTQLFFLVCLSVIVGCQPPNSKHEKFAKLLGDFPVPSQLNIIYLDTLVLKEGIRYRIQYTAEQADALLGTPIDNIRAYLFVPTHEEGQTFPGIVAIHQDGPKSHLGKNEPAGIAGDTTLFYGIELFRRGYVVICPDRFYHAERRRIEGFDTAGIDSKRDGQLYSHWVGQLLLQGRTSEGKEAYDLMRATDVLCRLDYVDTSRIGAIGHSAGGNSLVYFMFLDSRIKVGVSSCGFFELLDFYNEGSARRRNANAVIPSLAKHGKSADYLALIAPRPVLLTRGLREWGNGGIYGEQSKKHVESTKRIEEYAKKRYKKLEAESALKTIYFDENDGDHAFPPGVKREAYEWIDKYLKQ